MGLVAKWRKSSCLISRQRLAGNAERQIIVTFLWESHKGAAFDTDTVIIGGLLVMEVRGINWEFLIQGLGTLQVYLVFRMT